MTRINCVLGAVSISFAGCGTPKSAAIPAQQEQKDVVIPLPPEPEPAPAPSPDEPTPVKYGVPWYGERQ